MGIEQREKKLIQKKKLWKRKVKENKEKKHTKINF